MSLGYLRAVDRSRLVVSRADLLLAAGLLLVGQVELWLPVTDRALVADRATVAGLAAIVPAGLVLRRQLPIVAVTVAAAALVAQAIVAAPSILLAEVVALLVAVYSVAAHASRSVAVAGFAIACCGPGTMAVVSGDSGVGVASVALFAGAPWVAGRTVRRVRRYATLLEETTAALEAERARTAELAVAETRNQIARELHDVLAHGVGVMTLQAGGARRWVDRDPERVRTALSTIERSGREALDELRRLLDAVAPQGWVATEPQPDLLATCARLRESIGEAQPLRIEVSGTPRPLPSGLAVAASRILQEGVVNAVRHAPGSTIDAAVSYSDDEVCLSITNSAPTEPVAADRPGSGRGLLGMRERAALYGGSFSAGATPDRGFRVAVRLPTRGDA